jgi:hypothetical protein
MHSARVPDPAAWLGAQPGVLAVDPTPTLVEGQQLFSVLRGSTRSAVVAEFDPLCAAWLFAGLD